MLRVQRWPSHRPYTIITLKQKAETLTAPNVVLVAMEICLKSCSVETLHLHQPGRLSRRTHVNSLSEHLEYDVTLHIPSRYLVPPVIYSEHDAASEGPAYPIAACSALRRRPFCQYLHTRINKKKDRHRERERVRESCFIGECGKRP